MNYKNIVKTFQQAVPPTIMAGLIFFLTYYVFGSENTMIAPFATLSFLRFRTMRNHFSCMVKTFAIYLAMSVLSFLAVMNLPLCLLINALALFWVAYILIDEYHPNNYFPAGMALIFFQISPTETLPALANRMAALLATFVIMLLFLFVLTKVEKQEKTLGEKISEGFLVCRQILSLCEETQQDQLEQLHRTLFTINQNCSNDIYAFNRASLRRKDKTNWYCQFILFFQLIGYLSRHAEKEGNLAQAKRLYEQFHAEFEATTPRADYHKLNFRLRKPDIRSFRLRFALRQVITLTPCLVFAKCTTLPNAYWLVISVFFMMIPFTDHTMQRIRQRVLGTIGGILLCLALFSIFHGFGARVAIMMVANFLIYSTPGYGATVAYITCSALALQSLNSAVSVLLAYRLAYTLVGAIIALLANRYIFPIRFKYQIAYLAEMIRSIRKELTENTAPISPDDGIKKWKADQKIIKIYLLTKRLEGLHTSLPVEERTFDFDNFEKKHMDIMAEYFLSNTAFKK